MKYLVTFLAFVGLAASCPTDNSTQKPISIDYILERHHLEDKNVATVMDMMKELFGNKNVSALDEHLGENYIQHNPDVADGKEAVKAKLSEWFKGLPRSEFQLQRLAPNEDIVFVHWKSTELFGKIMSIVDIFRLENGKIVEHWDVIQEAPLDKKAANDHPFF